MEIIETIRWVFEDLPMLKEAMQDDLRQFSLNGNLKSYNSMKDLCDRYNTALKKTLLLVSFQPPGTSLMPVPILTTESFGQFTQEEALCRTLEAYYSEIV